MTKDELVVLVQKIKNADGTEEEIDAAIDLLELNVPDPNVSDLIFYDDLTAIEVVERAMQYKPIQL
jgi:hypothetical protein